MSQIKKAFYYDKEVADYLDGYRKRTGISASHIINKLAWLFIQMTPDEQRKFAEEGKVPERMSK